MPTSVLRKQAQPGGRKRSARAVNGGLDGRRERQASGHGYSRAAACFTERLGILPPGGSQFGLTSCFTKSSGSMSETLLMNCSPRRGWFHS